MILCDTDILIEFYRGNAAVVQQLHGIGVDSLAISAVTKAELYFGARNKTEQRQIRNHLDLLSTLHITQPISETFLELIASYALSHTLSIPDALIAATALRHDLPLYTRNVKDFRFIPGLSLYGREVGP